VTSVSTATSVNEGTRSAGAVLAALASMEDAARP